MKTRAGIAAVVVAVVAAAAPAGALAADTFADAAVGSDANACTSAASPCATIGAAVGKSGAGDTIRVAPGIYAEQVELGGGRSLRATGTAASTVIDGPAAPAIDVTSAAGTIEGFTIRAPNPDPEGTTRLGATASVRGNVFDADDDRGGTTRPVDLRIDSGSPTVSENTFKDDGVGNQIAISSFSGGSPAINENRIDGFFNGIEVQGGTATIRRNTITANHNSPTLSQGSSIGLLSGPTDVTANIEENVIRDPVTDGAGTPSGVSVLDFVSGPGNPSVGATLRRNRILGGSFGIQILGTVLPVTLDSDLIAGTSIFGLSTSETVAGSGDVTATNVTFATNSFDLSVNNAQLNLNSSIVEDGVSGTSPTCAISFSRGPTMVGGGNGCQNFQTTDPPLFVNAGAGDFHLQSGSTLRNVGDPAAPPGGALDIDGEPRQNSSCLPGAIQRDIGADETIGGGCVAPDTQLDSAPAAGPATAGGPAAGFPSPTFAFSGGPAFGCSLDGGYFVPCTAPRAYTGLAGGPHTFAVSTHDSDGFRDDTAATRTWTVDATTPDTQIDSGPAAGETSSASPRFQLGSEPGATFECSIDRAPFAACGPTFEPSGLSDGDHTLVVRAIDPVGNADPTAARRAWTVDATAPETTIDSGPADGSSTSARSVTYGFSANEAATFECAADGGGFSPCASPVTLDGLSPGAHTFAVRATDGVGNVDATPATRSVRVAAGGDGGDGDADTDPPETRVRKVKVRGDDAKVKFSSDERGSTFRCKLDRKQMKPCRSPRRFKNLDDGKHRIKVQAIDAAGNADPSPAKKRFGI